MIDNDLRQRLEQIPDGGSLDQTTMLAKVRRQVRRRRRIRQASIASAALALVVIVLVVGRIGTQSSLVTTDPAAPSDSGCAGPTGSVPMNTDPAGTARYRDWLCDYDPAEITYLRSQWASVPDENLVVTLEFRVACRRTNEALDAAEAAAPDQRANAVKAIMDPEVARLRERAPSAEDQSAAMFQRLADQIVAGELDKPKAFLAKDCADPIQADAHP